MKARDPLQKIAAAFGLVKGKYGVHHKIFTDGVYAILKALERLPEKGRENTVVYTDSASEAEAVEGAASHWIPTIEEEMEHTGAT